MISLVEADWKPKMVKVTYELFDPEIENMQKFFNGPVVEYYAIQSREDLTGEVSSATREMTRESLLDEALGFDVPLLNGKTKRDRKSTTTFKNVQKWYAFLQTMKETQFEPNGYEFPDSEAFWENVKICGGGQRGYEQAKLNAIQGLLRRIKGAMSTPEDD